MPFYPSYINFIRTISVVKIALIRTFLKEMGEYNRKTKIIYQFEFKIETNYSDKGLKITQIKFFIGVEKIMIK